MMHNTHAPGQRRRIPLLAHGSVSRPLILFLLVASAVLVYGYLLITTPSEQDRQICAEWLQQYTERVNSPAIFEKVGCKFKDITVTSHGFFVTVDIRTDKPCKHVPNPVDTYFSHNKIGMFLYVRLYAEGEANTSCTSLY